MSDTYLNLVNSGFTKKVAKQLGLPQPAPLRRYEPGQPLLEGAVLVLGRGSESDALAGFLSADWDLDVHRHATPGTRYSAVVLALTELTHPDQLSEPVLAVGSVLKSLPEGRARRHRLARHRAPTTPPRSPPHGRASTGCCGRWPRSCAAGRPATVWCSAADVPVTAPSVVGALRFFLSTKSAFVDGQLLAVDSAAGSLPSDWDEAAGRSRRRRHRGSPGHRRVDRRHPRPRRCHRRRGRRPRRRRAAGDRRQPRPRDRAAARRHGRRRRGTDPRARAAAARAARHRRAQRRDHPRQAAGQHVRPTSGTPCSR